MTAGGSGTDPGRDQGSGQGEQPPGQGTTPFGAVPPGQGTTPFGAVPPPGQGVPPSQGQGVPGATPPGYSPPGSGYPPPGQPPNPGVPGQYPQDEPPRQGSIQRQEPGVTQPRPPTVAETRARDKARRRAEEAQRAAAAAADTKRRTRNRVLIGGVAVVGVAGLVGGGYLAYRAITAPDRVTASCVQINEKGQEVVVEDKYCQPGQSGFVDDDSRSHGGGIVVLGGWPQYRYYYGGSTTVGKPPTGATTVRPKGAEIKTRTGTTVQRGGLGSKSTGGSGS